MCVLSPIQTLPTITNRHFLTMRKPITFASLLFSLTISSCFNTGQDTFPQVISVVKSDSLTRVKGTRLFVKVPNTYQPLEKLVRYQKNDDTYFQVIEDPNGSFNEFVSNMSKQAIESKGAKVDVYENVKFNGLDGLYFEGPSKNAGETKIGLAFGDFNFVTMVVGVCKTADKNSIQELKTIFRSSYYDTSYKLNPLELASFKIDQTITGFTYSTTLGNVFLYSHNGRKDLKGLLDFSNYQIMPLEVGSFEKVKELMESINTRFNLQGINVSNIKSKETLINGNNSYEVTMDAIDKEGNKASLYEVGIFQENSSSGLLFLSIDADMGIYLEKFKATAQTIEL